MRTLRVGVQPCEVLNTYVATSSGGDGQSWSPQQVSSIGHQPNFEMFGNRRDPFHGDYIWVDADGGAIFGVWTDNRDVVSGPDPRESDDDGFDVLQCRAQDPGAQDPDTVAFGADTCPNAGGLNRNIYGAAVAATP